MNKPVISIHRKSERALLPGIAIDGTRDVVTVEHPTAEIRRRMQQEVRARRGAVLMQRRDGALVFDAPAVLRAGQRSPQQLAQDLASLVPTDLAI